MNRSFSQPTPLLILHRAKAIKVLCAAAILMTLLCGCSSFNRAWRKAGKTPAPPESMEGRWEGHWLSEANGHTGRLRCLLSREPGGEYTAWFRATYLKILNFSYRVPLQVQASNSAWAFQGSEDLGSMAGGVYHYTGSATPTNFHSIYSSRYDHGFFEMNRP